MSEYTNQSYLAHDVNWAITQDERGQLFVGNNDGLVIYSGSSWLFYHVLNNKEVKSISFGTDSTIFIGGNSEFGYFYPNDLSQLSYYSISSHLPDSVKFTSVWQVHNTTHGVYFRTDYYLFRWFEDELTIFSEGDRLYKSFLVDDEVWFTKVRRGINRIIDGEFLKVEAPDTLKEKFATSIFKTNEDKVKVVYWDGSIFEYEDENWGKIIDVSTAYPNVRVRDAVQYEGNTVLATRSDGIILVDQNKKISKSLRIGEGTVNKDIYDIFLDKDGLIWLATNSGIEKINLSAPLTKISKKNGLEGVVNVLHSSYGRVFIGTSRGLYQIDLSNNESVSRLKGNIFLNDINTASNTIYFATNSGLFGFERDSIFQVTGQRSYALIVPNKKRNMLVVSMQDSISLFKKNQRGWEFETKVRFTGESIVKTALKDGIVYGISNQNRFFRIRGVFSDSTDFDVIALNYNLRNVSILGKEVTISTDQGLLFFDSENGELYRKNSFSSYLSDSTQQVFTIKESKIFENTFWVNTRRKVHRFWQDSLGVHYNRKPFQLFEDRDVINTIFEERDKEVIWFGAVRNLYRFDPNLEFSSASFKTNITGIYVNNDSLIYGGFGEPVNPIVLPYEDNELRFTYAAASYIDETRNTYSVKLEGFDESWSDWSLETQKDYTNIPEGDYVFKVRSKNVYEVDGREDQILFSVLPPWYRTWWAYLLYLIGFSGLVYSAHRIRLNQLLKVERMRTKIASDLHDDVSATLTGISYFAEAVKTDENEEKKNHFINLITESAGDAKEKITDIVWSITPENDDWSLFLAKCRRYASDLLESSGMEYSLNITDFIPGKLKMNTRQHLWMIFKEILTNAVRHSGGKRIDLILDVEDGVLKLIVQDDGNGFDISSKSFGNGVTNIRKRAEAIKADLELDSETKMGTRWRLELKL